VFDPVAVEEAKKAINQLIPSAQQDRIHYSDDIYDTINEVDALMLVTEWKEFRMPNWQIVSKLMKNKIILDGRNIYDKKELTDIGFIYVGIGV